MVEIITYHRTLAATIRVFEAHTVERPDIVFVMNGFAYPGRRQQAITCYYSIGPTGTSVFSAGVFPHPGIRYPLHRPEAHASRIRTGR